MDRRDLESLDGLLDVDALAWMLNCYEGWGLGAAEACLGAAPAGVETAGPGRAWPEPEQ